MTDKLGGRKFIFALLVTILGFSLVVLHQVNPKDWFAFIQLIGGIYVLSNMSEKAVDIFTPKSSK